MLKKDNVFHWDDQQTRSFQQVKTLIAKANTRLLRYYDRNLPVTVQADTSLRGLGACLIQQHKGKDQPITFASKSLMDAETRYANIERELLAIVFACQHFSTYLLGRSFVAESDHKPLEMIAMKNLANAPPRLQRAAAGRYRDMMSPSSTDQGRKCNWPTPLAAARREPHKKSNWICE